MRGRPRIRRLSGRRFVTGVANLGSSTVPKTRASSNTDLHRAVLRPTPFPAAVHASVAAQAGLLDVVQGGVGYVHLLEAKDHGVSRAHACCACAASLALQRMIQEQLTSRHEGTRRGRGWETQPTGSARRDARTPAAIADAVRRRRRRRRRSDARWLDGCLLRMDGKSNG